MIHIAICDDEEKDRRELDDYCKKFIGDSGNFTLKLYDSGEAFLRDGGADILLLDIEMDGVDGIEIKRRLAREEQTAILFVTSHEGYMPKAFGPQVFGFLRKTDAYGAFAEQMREMGTNLEKRYRYIEVHRMSRKYSKEEGGIEKILIRDVNYIEAKRKYVCFHLSQGSGEEESFLEDGSYGYWAEKLQDCDFLEVKRGKLVNLANVRKVRKQDGMVYFSDGTKLESSFRLRQSVKDGFEQYLRDNAR